MQPWPGKSGSVLATRRVHSSGVPAWSENAPSPRPGHRNPSHCRRRLAPILAPALVSSDCLTLRFGGCLESVFPGPRGAPYEVKSRRANTANARTSATRTNPVARSTAAPYAITAVPPAATALSTVPGRHRCRSGTPQRTAAPSSLPHRRNRRPGVHRQRGRWVRQLTPRLGTWLSGSLSSFCVRGGGRSRLIR